MIWRAGVARFRAGAQAAISVQSPDSGLMEGELGAHAFQVTERLHFIDVTP
jgi:hypothetical protein